MSISCKKKIILHSQSKPSYNPANENEILLSGYSNNFFKKSDLYLYNKINKSFKKINRGLRQSVSNYKPITI